MGYYTSFYGEFEITPKLAPEHERYLRAFTSSRRMKRHSDLAAALGDEIRQAVGLPAGIEGEYHVAGNDDADESVVDLNNPPRTQPSLYCSWEIGEDGTSLLIPEQGKHYYYEEWLNYLVDNFFKLWGYELGGEVTWSGEEDDDKGTIYAKENMIEVWPVEINYPSPSWEK